MPELKYFQNTTMWEGTDATGVGSLGVLYEVEGELFIDDTPLMAYLEQFIGRKCMFEFVFPDEAKWEIEEKILPLVQVLQRKHWRTIGSCEGHFPPDKEFDRPYVSIWCKFKPKLKVPPDWEWEVSKHHSDIWRLQTIKRAKSAEDLERLQALIPEAVKFYS